MAQVNAELELLRFKIGEYGIRAGKKFAWLVMRWCFIFDLNGD